jgi:hypothetical protein
LIYHISIKLIYSLQNKVWSKGKGIGRAYNRTQAISQCSPLKAIPFGYFIGRTAASVVEVPDGI